ncbi:DUF2111 domain-containing protein [Methanohalobium sp.]|uniref:DUF2111 domain-containing protein n=1 Tax=Methanohalobium sp. TaxID=2837493 RepID=UPI002600BEE0|nr:DUF2111 domain-containing protein [Methanohalobium sp.]
MGNIKITENSSSDDLEPLALAIHTLIGIPTTIRSKNKNGIRMERGEVADRDYTGPILEQVIKTDKTIRDVPQEGVYKGRPVVVTPLHSSDGTLVAALGVVDLVAALDILSLFSAYPGIIDEVEEAKNRLNE